MTALATVDRVVRRGLHRHHVAELVDNAREALGTLLLALADAGRERDAEDVLRLRGGLSAPRGVQRAADVLIALSCERLDAALLESAMVAVAAVCALGDAMHREDWEP